MLSRILAVSLAAGALAGLLSSGIQHFVTVPLIIKAESYEKADETPAHIQSGSWEFNGARVVLAHNHAPADGDQHEVGAWEPADGLERTAYTSLATVGTAVGFSLILLAAMLASGVPVTARSAAMWGLGAFIATGLAPGLGLPPEIPGSAAAELLPRQIWWISTAAATAAGIWLLFQREQLHFIVAAFALIAAPHLIGAPHAAAFQSTAPAELAGHFASASLAVQAILWTSVGALAGLFWQNGFAAGRHPGLAETQA